MKTIKFKGTLGILKGVNKKDEVVEIFRLSEENKVVKNRIKVELEKAKATDEYKTFFTEFSPFENMVTLSISDLLKIGNEKDNR